MPLIGAADAGLRGGHESPKGINKRLLGQPPFRKKSSTGCLIRQKSLTWHRMNTGLIKNQKIWGTVIKIPLTMLARKEKRSVRKEDARLVGLKGELKVELKVEPREELRA